MNEHPRHSQLSRMISWLAFGVGFYAFYFLSSAVPTRLVWYYPLERRFAFELASTGLAMDYYGRLLFSVATGAAAHLAARFALGARLLEVRRAWLQRMAVWSFGLLVFTAGLYLYSVGGRETAPEAQPRDEPPAGEQR